MFKSAFLRLVPSVALISGLFPIGAPFAAGEVVVPSDGAVVELAGLPREATVTIDGRDYGTQRRFTYRSLRPGRRYKTRVVVQGRQGQEAASSVSIEGGRLVRLGLVVDDSGEYQLVSDDLVDLIAGKKVEVRAQGSGIDSATLEVRRLVNYDLSVRIPVGTFLVSRRSSVQNMVTTDEHQVVLDDEEWHSISVPAACANRPREIPGSGDSFQIRRSPNQRELAQLMPVLRDEYVSFGVRQAAVWIVTDNADYNDLGTLVVGSFGGFGGTRAIDEEEAARAMKICDEAGIDITRKRIWRDRSKILQALSDGDLKTWLQQRGRR